MLKAEKISCSLSGRTIVDNASLELVSGRVTALTGPNGAGKTTLFRILCGEMSPGAGSIEVAGRSLQKWPVAEISRFRGVLFQESHLNFPFTVQEVALLGRLPHLGKRETAADYEIAHQALQMMDMDSLAGRLFTTLSGGEKQRVQIARVLAQIWEVSPQPGLPFDARRAHRQSRLGLPTHRFRGSSSICRARGCCNSSLARSQPGRVLCRGSHCFAGRAHCATGNP